MAEVSVSGYPCPGCGAQIRAAELACRRCQGRLPRQLRRTLAAAQRQRHRDHQPYLDALNEVRQWWALHREPA